MDKAYRILVFGKAGCQKCTMLNRRIDRLLALPEWQEFEKHYCDLGTEEGLVAFCRAQCVNPNRIPAMLVTRRDDDGNFVPVSRRRCEARDPVCGSSALYQYLGLQTDYGEEGSGVIRPEMVEAVLAMAKAG